MNFQSIFAIQCLWIQHALDPRLGPGPQILDPKPRTSDAVFVDLGYSVLTRDGPAA